MLSLIILFSLISCAVFSADQLCTMTLQPARCSGTFVKDGFIKMRRSIVHLPSGKPACFEAEDADTLLFQADVFARKAGATGVELLQIKRKASEYAPQNDIPDASGKYIDYCQQASWQFRALENGKYTIWFRLQVPFVGWWSFNYDIDGAQRNSVSLLHTVKKEKQWTWVNGGTVDLSADIHNIVVHNLLNGKKLDQFIIAPKGFVPPKDGASLAATPAERIDDGSVLFKTAAPVGITKWKYHSVEEAAGIQWLVSADDGASFTAVPSDRDISSFGSKPLTIKGLFHCDNEDIPPIKLPVLVFERNENAFHVIETETAKWLFSRENGSLSGIVSKITKREIQPVGQRMKMFTLTLKEPDKKERSTLSESDAKLIKCELSPKHDNLLICWELQSYDIRLVLNLRVSGVKLLWNLTIDNQNKSLDVIEVHMPDIQELCISSNFQNDRLVWPFVAGEFIPVPAHKGQQLITYPDHAGLPFADLYNETEGLYFAIEDTFIVSSDLICKPNETNTAVSLSATKKHRIPVGSSRTYTFATALHQGDWHNGAKLYRKWFYDHYPINSYRPWLRNIDAWEFGTALGYDALTKKPKDYTAFRDDMLAAARLGLSYIQAWGVTANGPCPAYYLPRKEKGGEELFAKMMAEWRSLGGYIGHYYYANGIALYYLLSDKYFCTPWSDYPEDVRPPSYEWYLRNRTINSKTLPIAPMDEIMETIRQLNQEALEDSISKPQQQESRKPLGAHLPMNWNNGEYPDFLYKWIARYVEKYHCNTAYLDTFAFINALPDFNPQLKLNGEGDKPMHKIAFLKRLMTDMRKIEPEFCAITEGVGDVFGANGLYFLLSGFSRNPSIYRYTLPDHIFFLGGCNNWSAQTENTRQAFLYGNRIDLLSCKPTVYHVLRLRQILSPFMNLSTFEDNIGITCSSPKVECYVLACNSEGNTFIDNHGTRSIMLTMSNPSAQDCTISYRLPKGFTVNAALLCQMDAEPQRVTPNIEDGVLSLQAPKSFVSAMLLIDEAKSENSWTAYTEQLDRDTFAVQMMNYLDKEIALQIDAGFEKKDVVIPPFSPARMDFRSPDKQKKPVIVPVTISGEGRKVKLLTAFGPDYRPPELEKPLVKITKESPLSFDFEENRYSSDNPRDGRRSLKLIGNGKFCCVNYHILLEPNSKYEIEFDLCKSPDCSGEKRKCFVLVCNYTEGRKRLDYLKPCADENEVPRDGQYHHVRHEFRTFNDVTDPVVYIYNSDSEDGVIFLDNLRIRRL